MKFPESRLAHQLLDGLVGIEIGGSAHNPFNIPGCVNVDYTADLDTVFKQEELRLCGEALPVHVVAPAWDLPFDDASLDFVLSSHVIEHCWDVIGTVEEWFRVLKPGGLVFMVVPHKERTFDKDRERTPLEELIARHTDGEREAMTQSTRQPSLDDVLNAFAVEQNPGRETLERYLQGYPQYADDLVELSRELSRIVVDNEGPLPEKDQQLIDTAWRRHLAAASEDEISDPFATLSAVDLHEHYSVWVTQDWYALCRHMGWKIIYLLDVDDKVGNAFTVVLRKPAT